MERHEVFKVIEDYYRKNRTNLIKSTYKRAGNSIHNAEDVVQEAFLKACLYWKSYKPEYDSFEQWFIRILGNCCNTFINTERNKGMTLSDDRIDSLHVFYPSAYFTSLLNEIKTDINLLPKDKRYVISLILLEEFSPKDVSEIVDINVGTVKTMVYRFKEELKDKYGESLYR